MLRDKVRCALFDSGCRLELRDPAAIPIAATKIQVLGQSRICGRPVVVPEGLSNVVAIAAGQTFCLAITTNAVVAERFRR